MSERVTVTIADHVADVRLARPDKMNALDPAMFAALAATIDDLKARTDVRCVVLSGDGRAFCAGLDMAAMASGGSGIDLDTRTHGIANLAQYVAWGWRELPMPVIAALHGVALGGGLQIASGADVRLAHPATRLSIRELHWGIVPDMGGIALWRTLARDDVLRELTYTAREFDAAEAAGFGLVTRLSEDPLGEAMALARDIAGRNPHAIRGAKRLYNVAADTDAAGALRAESDEQLKVIRTPNQIEQVMANMQKRAAMFVD
ncbi:MULTISPECIES: crotonase/enoyl-CoA hydratase family protein [unclassified Sphingomonas]|jgi:enoyl-CoA hydratase/carnithine racemase|uniref:crotonase/enoyl-CoA hydratase family protein n=1 Tax=unclassified Sphingomonas TaxID=196159 RepID=UPI000E101AAF|nr:MULTISPECIES: crotonase/enoyl-CoA hydratase family protein [unclassified Sphingomonas]AXJ94534.1 crotonase/enoyl-CoA hydratase family protein [Sphingomonas sp. FARSPH]